MSSRHKDLLRAMRTEGRFGKVPGKTELAYHLSASIEEVGDKAFADFSYVQRIAADMWGARPTAHFAQVLREARVGSKVPPLSDWDRARSATNRLPAEYRPQFLEKIERSQTRRPLRGETIWSAPYLLSVAHAFARWLTYCNDQAISSCPSGRSFEQYARQITSGDDPTSVRSASDYLCRIIVGYQVIDPSFHSDACEFVAKDWKELADALGATTKTGSQLVGATALYDLGFELIDAARKTPLRGLGAAQRFRNGLMLSIGIALPQRARALSALDFGTTLAPLNSGEIHVFIPVEMLKLPASGRATAEPFEVILRNESLAQALHEYRRDFRPLFDDGSCLFPSRLSPGEALASRSIGHLVGNITEKAFGVRISIHRFRDNVATEATEVLQGGRTASSVLLGHGQIATTDKHYDHSQGIMAQSQLAANVDGMRTQPVDLLL